MLFRLFQPAFCTRLTFRSERYLTEILVPLNVFTSATDILDIGIHYTAGISTEDSALFIIAFSKNQKYAERTFILL